MRILCLPVIRWRSLCGRIVFAPVGQHGKLAAQPRFVSVNPKQVPDQAHRGVSLQSHLLDGLIGLRTEGLLRLDIDRPDHLGPLLGFLSDKPSELGGRTTQYLAA
jgi:hypothetical protein